MRFWGQTRMRREQTGARAVCRKSRTNSVGVGALDDPLLGAYSAIPAAYASGAGPIVSSGVVAVAAALLLVL